LGIRGKMKDLEFERWKKRSDKKLTSLENTTYTMIELLDRLNWGIWYPLCKPYRRLKYNIKKLGIKI
jgi:hypothetical protein